MKLRRPWVSAPFEHDLGTGRGTWWKAMTFIGVVLAAVVVVLLLVNAGKLDRGWAYACLPVAFIAAASTRVLTIFKGRAEDQPK